MGWDIFGLSLLRHIETTDTLIGGFHFDTLLIIQFVCEKSAIVLFREIRTLDARGFSCAISGVALGKTQKKKTVISRVNNFAILTMLLLIAPNTYECSKYAVTMNF